MSRLSRLNNGRENTRPKRTQQTTRLNLQRRDQCNQVFAIHFFFAIKKKATVEKAKLQLAHRNQVPKSGLKKFKRIKSHYDGSQGRI